MQAGQPTQSAAREAVERLYRAFSTKDVALLRQAVTPDWEYIPEPPGQKPGPDQMIPIFDDLATALPDMRIDILDMLVQDDRVGIRAEVSGTQSGPLLGIAATKKPIRFAIHSFHQLRDGLVSKTWHLEDWLSVFRQLDAVPPRVNPPV
ncbi:polyketide cyclase [Caballeronia turbans]|jgi:predicted ester cyclase|uniref:ester cyclase n=1 Tax=unclassified Caballeronia TaxID=2646786 RepID=UPI00074C0458|nr:MULTISPECIES: ester cyclase [unclassified Caballeronia]SAL14927.1 polyketide cyclase [Caballeronia turbans]